MTKEQAPKAKGTDLEKLEKDYRANILSLRELGAKHGISEGMVRKHARTHKWARDLGAKIKAKADELVRKEQVRSEVRSKADATDIEVIEANAEAISRIRLAHREDIQRSRNLVRSLMSELEVCTDNPDEFAQLGDLLGEFKESGAPTELTRLYQKVVSRSGRVSDLKSLSEALKNLIGLERQAWSMDDVDKASGDDPTALSDDELDARITARLAAAR